MRAPLLKFMVAFLGVVAIIVNTPVSWVQSTIHNELRGIATLDFSAPMATQPVNRLARALDATPIGSLGPKGTSREHFVYYDSLYFLAMQYGRHAKTFMEVGCASDPFAQYLGWIDSRKCVAPYQVIYEKGAEKKQADEVEFIKADWMEYKLEEKYDLLVCSQVVEHVDDPAAFTKKLISAANTTIISVPYLWPECGNCNHKTNKISLETMRTWAAPYIPRHHTIIDEGTRGATGKRLIVVFQK